MKATHKTLTAKIAKFNLTASIVPGGSPLITTYTATAPSGHTIIWDEKGGKVDGCWVIYKGTDRRQTPLNITRAFEMLGLA